MKTVHILHRGRALCGFSQEVPSKWPQTDVWVDRTDAKNATCSNCRAGEMHLLLLEIDDLLPRLEWKVVETVPYGYQGVGIKQLRSYSGTGNGWLINVACYEMTNPRDGSPMTIYEGAGSNMDNLTLLRLTREVTKKAFEAAEAAMKKVS